MKKLSLILLIIVYACQNLSPEEKKQIELEKQRKQDSIEEVEKNQKRIADSIKIVKDSQLKRIQDSIIKVNKKRLKNAKIQTVFNLGINKFKVSNIKINNQWVFDRYNDRYFLYTAERGEDYLSATVRITSTSKNPILEPFYIYKYNDGKINFVTRVNYQFFRWQDYGKYLGNYHDKNNDFRYKESVLFTVGTSRPESFFKNETYFLVVDKSAQCYFRKNNEYGNPPVYYQSDCKVYDTLSVDDFLGNYVIVKKFNINNL